MIINTDELGEVALADLKKAQAKINKAIEDFATRKERAFADKVAALAKEEGIPLANALDILSKSRGGASKPSVAKYRHREDHSKTWTGRGKRPNWYEEFGEPVEQA